MDEILHPFETMVATIVCLVPAGESNQIPGFLNGGADFRPSTVASLCFPGILLENLLCFDTKGHILFIVST